MEPKKTVLITGVSREMGLGYETAKQLAEKGYTVIITARDLQAVQLLAEKIDVKAMALNITDDESVEALAEAVTTDFGTLDVLINNAGAFYDQGGQLLETDINFIKDALDTNLLGAWRMTKAFLPLLKKSKAARIVNVSSGAGSFADPDFGFYGPYGTAPVYAVSKLALNGLTVEIAKELKDTGIKINAVCPGFTATHPGTEAYGARPVSDGAQGIVWAATLPDDGPTGGFFRDGKELGW